MLFPILFFPSPVLPPKPFLKLTPFSPSNRPSSNFLISPHPHSANLILATGGSGHAFKFFPVIGDLVVKAVEGTLEDEWCDLWAWREGDGDGVEEGDVFETSGDGSRGGPRGLRL